MENIITIKENGVDKEYYVIAETVRNGRTYVLYTDFSSSDGDDFNLSVGYRDGDEYLPASKEFEEELLREFSSEIEKNMKTIGNYDIDSLSFETVVNGVSVLNDVVGVVPNSRNNEEPYVVFTDYSLDDNDEFINQYGKLIEENGEFKLETNLSELEIGYIKHMLDDDIVEFVNKKLRENFNES